MSNLSMTAFLPLLQKLARIELGCKEVDELGVLLAEVNDWNGVIRQAELYAVSGLLFKHVSSLPLKPPLDVMLSLKALSIRHRAAADARYKVVQELSSRFAEHDIAWVALKGLVLAPLLYPADELRPMRDIDVLVPRDQEALAADVIREMGFNLPLSQPSKFMRGSHQLPNATMLVNGFTISVEIHHDAFARDVPGHLFYEDVEPSLQIVQWRNMALPTLGHEQMLHQISRHLEGLHPGAVLKLINVMDVVLYSEQLIDDINWPLLRKRYSHVINTLRCLHFIMPLSPSLQAVVGGVIDTAPNNKGEIMQSLSHIFQRHNLVKKVLALLFTPSDWWLHLYYNVDPGKSLLLVKLVKHPVTIGGWLCKRLYSRLLGG